MYFHVRTVPYFTFSRLCILLLYHVKCTKKCQTRAYLSADETEGAVVAVAAVAAAAVVVVVDAAGDVLDEGGLFEDVAHALQVDAELVEVVLRGAVVHLVRPLGEGVHVGQVVLGAGGRGGPGAVGVVLFPAVSDMP